MKKKVIAYIHTHWDKEWYREFEVFRLRLLRIFDNVIDMLENEVIPSFYFDGQVCALLDYLELRPEKEGQIRKLIADKKLFIGPFYTLVDEFLCDDVCFRKNLELGIKISKNFGCEDYIAYFADTFGHSKNTIPILKDFAIDKCMVWRGVPENIPSEFIFNGMNTVNMVRGYFMDIFSAKLSIEAKAEFLAKNLDLIAAKSGETLLLPIGADHLGVPVDLVEQIKKVNELLENYEITIGSPFDYFNEVENNFKTKFNDELRDNSQTFILPGCYSARMDIKQWFGKASYKLKLADDFQKKCGSNYEKQIEYAYKLLLQNLAHDGICGCSTDDVHLENIIRYKKVLQIAETIIKELIFEGNSFELSGDIEEFEDTEIHQNAQVISKRNGFEDTILYDTQRIPVTEDYTEIYRQIKQKEPSPSTLKVSDNTISNDNLLFFVKDGQFGLKMQDLNLSNLIEFVKSNDVGDTYNFAPDIKTPAEYGKILSSKVILNGPFRGGILVKTDILDVEIYLDNNSKLLKFKVKLNNTQKNKLWQVKFNLPEEIKETFSEDMGRLIKREFDPEYELANAFPKSKGIEAKTNAAPMQRFVWANGLGIVTKGLREYAIKKNSIYITLLRGCSIISNPKNPARTTPAGPPIELEDAQMQGEYLAEFAIALCKKEDYKKLINEIYPQVI